MMPTWKAAHDIASLWFSTPS